MHKSITGLLVPPVLYPQTYLRIESLPLPRLQLFSVLLPLSFGIHCLTTFVHPAPFQFVSLA